MYRNAQSPIVAFWQLLFCILGGAGCWWQAGLGCSEKIHKITKLDGSLECIFKTCCQIQKIQLYLLCKLIGHFFHIVTCCNEAQSFYYKEQKKISTVGPPSLECNFDPLALLLVV